MAFSRLQIAFKILFAVFLSFSFVSASAQLTFRQDDLSRLGGLIAQPMGFEKYDGPYEGEFIARAGGYSVFLSHGEIRLIFPAASGSQFTPEIVRIRFAGSNQESRPEPEDALPGVIHYYLGKNPSQWRTDVHRFRKVRYREIYPGIGVAFYGSQQSGGRQELEFDFDVSPGHDAGAISIKVDGASVRELEGNLELVAPSGKVALLRRPQLYQLRQERRAPIDGGYVLGKSNEIHFAVAEYDRALPLVIDPALGYSTFIQRLLELTVFPGQFPPGTESFEGDSVSGIAADSTGAAYITGSAFVPDPSFGFLPGPPILPATNNTVSRAFVVKLDPTGSSLVYTTYIGGNSSPITSSGGNSIALDASTNAYIVGVTNSPTFPATPSTFSSTPVCSVETVSNKRCDEPFVAKFDSTGHLVFSTYLVNGGSTDTAGPALGRQKITVDPSGGIYVAGFVGPALILFPKDPAPPSVAGLPVTPGAFQTTRKSNFSSFVLKLHPDGSALDYSTYLGGSTNDTISGVAADAAGVAYVAGRTTSADFPTTGGAFQTTNPGTSAFFSKLKADGKGLLYSTFLGAAGINSEADGIAIDGSTNAILGGTTSGPGFPTTAGAFKTNVAGAGLFNFVSEFDTAGNLAFSTYIGSANTTGVAVDASGVYIAGVTNSASYPLLNSIEPPPLPGESPMYVTKLNLTGSALVYSSFVGNSLTTPPFAIGNAGLSSMALDSNQNIYLAGVPNDVFPTTLGAFQVLPQTQPLTAHASFVTKLAASLGAPVAVVTPRVFTFPDPPLQQGVSSAPALFKLSNYGDADFSFTGVSIAGANASDFSQTNNCTATVAAGQNCLINVVFTPTVPSGTRVANLVFTFGGGLPTQAVPLTGKAGSAIFQISSTPGDFGTVGQLENSIKSFTITNVGTGPLIMTSARFIPAGDFPNTDFSFGPTNLGPSPLVLQPGQSTQPFQIWMHIGLNFGNLTGQFRVDDNTATSPHVFQLTGFGFHTTPDFGMSTVDGAAATATVTAGQTATYNLIVASLPGFGLGGGSISVSCSGAPAGAKCNLDRTSLPLPDNNPEAVVVSVTTTAATASLEHHSPTWLWPVAAFAGIAWIRPRKNRQLRFVLTLCGLTVIALITACGGGGDPKDPPVTTPPGTYTLTITASSGSVSHSMPLTLIVK